MNWRLWIWLLVLSVLGILLGIPLTVSVLEDPASGSSVDSLDICLMALKEFFLFLFPASFTGVLLSKKIGLSFNFSTVIDAGKSMNRTIRYIIYTILCTGILLAIPGLVGYYILPEGSFGTGLNNPTPFEWLLRSISAAITEELAFRYGLMTLIAWIFLSLRRDTAFRKTALWTGNILTAIVFAMAHLPSILSSDPLNWGVISSVFLFNTVGGIAMGWLYLRYGLLSAVFCHIIADFVQHVLPRII
jgi:membrane protease YdiL (CAAX protease family)